jgi:transcriptional regulator with GAF, ATPase, and Fis domain
MRGLRKDGSEVTVDVSVNHSPTPAGPILIGSIAQASAAEEGDAAERAALEDALAFERAIAALSGYFIDVSGDRIDDAIRQGLGQACELVQLDRAAVVRLGPEGVLRSRIAWSVPQVEPIDTAVVVRDRFPWTFDQLLSGEVVSFSSVEEVPDEVDRGSYAAAGVQSSLAMPLLLDGRVTAFIGFGAIQAPRAWSPELVERLNVIAGVFAQVVARQQRDEALQAAMEESQRLKNQLHVENVFLRTEARDRLAPAEIVGRSPALRQVLAQAEQVASTDSTVLLLGETGTGKEVCAQVIHRASERHGRSMITVNCGAIPATLIESELFGREKGAFTGALARQIGRFEMAHESTIFLDEIAELPLDAQVKLLRVIQERVIERLGGGQPVKVNVRIIAATNRNLEKAVADRTFREDLFYRLNVFPITIPPLRERVEDIPALVWSFIEEYSAAFRKPIDSISRESVAALKRYSWPGNVRELRNVIERAVIISKGPHLVVELPASAGVPAVPKSTRLHDLEVDQIRAVLESVGWRVRGPGGAAELLGLKPNTLDSRMAKLGIRRQPRRPN